MYCVKIIHSAFNFFNILTEKKPFHLFNFHVFVLIILVLVFIMYFQSNFFNEQKVYCINPYQRPGDDVFLKKL